MKRSIIISALLMFCYAASAQITIVKGVVLDSLTRAAEPAAVISFFRSGVSTSPVAFTVTDENGSFSKDIKGKGEYELHLDNMGRKSRVVVFEIKGQEVIDLGEILIEDDVQALEAGRITAQKTLVVMDVDRITYKVEDDVDSKTSTVLDMLRKVPMVSVDGQDNITVNGSPDFQIYVDGRPNQMISSNPGQILKLMPASVVKNIEVITNPGAKYDAEGVGGVLNITTDLSATGGKSVSDGQYASLSLLGSTKGLGGGIYYSMQKGKWAFSINGNTSEMNINGALSESERIQKLESGDFITRNSGESDIHMPFRMGNANLSYEIDSLNLITLGVGFMSNDMDYEAPFRADFTSPLMEYSYGGTVFTRTATHGITANLDYQHIWSGQPDRSLVLSYQFSGTPSHNVMTNRFDSDQIQGIQMTDRRSDGFTNSLSHTVQADFSTPLSGSSAHIVNAGAKFIARHNLSERSEFVAESADGAFIPEGSMEYDFYNDIGALYAEYNGKAGQFSFKAGARYEHTWQKVEYPQGNGKDFNLDYGNLVPMASIQYTISQQQNLGLSYNMRISRPGITYLNPFTDNISDPTASTYGNPDLEPETGHTISAVYNYFSPKWIVSLTVRQAFTGNGISQYSFYDREHVMNTTYGNIVSTATSGLNAFLTWIPGQKTRVIFNGGCSFTDIRSDVLSQSNSGWSYNVLAGLQQTLPWDLRLSVNTIASGRTISLQGHSSGMVMGAVGMTKSFIDDRLSISINGQSDLTGGRCLMVESVSETTDFLSRTLTGIPLRMVSVNLSFSFGRQDGIKVRKSRKSIGEDSQIDLRSTTESLGSMMKM